MLYKIVRLAALLFFGFFTKLRVEGHDQLPSSEAFILTPNHFSNLDVFILSAAVKKEFYTLSKKELFKNPFSRFLLTRLHGIPVNRKGFCRQTLKAALDILQQNKVLAIFPEGYVSKNGEMGRFKQGVARLALEAKREIDGLMWLIKQLLPKEIVEMNKNNVQFGTIGILEPFPEDVKHEINKAVLLTRDNDGLKLRFALNYSARNEMVHAAKNISQDVKAGRYSIDEIDETLVSSHLFTAGLPDPDLLIRTSGEMRFSNFLLWQIVDAVFWVTPVLWPDFNQTHLMDAIEYWQETANTIT